VNETCLRDLLTKSGTHIPQLCGAAWSSRWLTVQWPMASTLASLCLGQRRTCWTYVVIVSLFSLYLMNFTFHIMLDAAGIVLRVHYKSMKCDVSIFARQQSTIFRWGTCM